MRVLCVVLLAASLAAFVPKIARSENVEYDGCNEQFYDSSEEPCGGGHQHQGGKRDEVSLERSRHRHRYLEEQIKELSQKVDRLTGEVAELEKAGAK